MARLAAAALLLLPSCCAVAAPTAPTAPTPTPSPPPPPGAHHILFLASDDMRPEMSPYGHGYMKTPSFQRLADDGFTFRRSYVQQALCAPSRTVLLTGRRPDTSRVWTIGPYFRDTTGRNWTTLPQFFKEHSWRSIGHGKIFHEGYKGFDIISDHFSRIRQPHTNPCVACGMLSVVTMRMEC